MDFRSDSPKIRKCKNDGFSQGFAMGSLLMAWTLARVAGGGPGAPGPGRRSRSTLPSRYGQCYLTRPGAVSREPS